MEHRGQTEEIRKFCDKHEDWKVVRILKDAGFSAATLERPGIQNLLFQAQQKQIDVAVVWKYDRLSRDNVDFPVLLQFLKENKVEIASINEPADVGSPYGEFVVGIMGLVATLERRMIQMRVKMAMKTRAKNGLWHGGIPPYGYSYDKNNGKLEINNKEKEVVLQVFKEYLNNGSLYTTKDNINQMGFRTRRSTFWGLQAIRTILKRRQYLGVLKCSGVEIVDPLLRVIEDDIYMKAQEAMKIEKEVKVPLFQVKVSMKHNFVGKRNMPACPRCENQQSVRRKGYRILADGSSKRKYYCNLCDAEFDEETANIEVPPCPDCYGRGKVQYFGTRESNDGVLFRVFGCRKCGNRFRTIVDSSNNGLINPLGSTAVRAVSHSAV